MRIHRSKRIIQTLEVLRSSSIITAHAIATELKISERTVYRYIAELTQAGYPIEGEAGVGYRLRIGHDPQGMLQDLENGPIRKEPP